MEKVIIFIKEEFVCIQISILVLMQNKLKFCINKGDKIEYFKSKLTRPKEIYSLARIDFT